MPVATIPAVIALAIVAAVIVAEVILAMTWNRFYLTFGLPIFVKRVERLASLEDVSLEYLQKRMATAGGSPLVFRRLDPNAIAFRESGLGGVIHFTPLMRGLIRHNHGEPAVAVIGFANWFIVVGTIVLVAALRRNVVHIAPMFLFAIAVLYLIQGVRFWRLAKALREPAMEPETLAP
jgi:hypothetical protein